jgi:polygalacturonase
LHVATENIVIQGCRMKDGHGGITIGSEISGGVRNLFAEGCRLDSPSLVHALRVKNNAMRGGVLENIYFRDIEVGEVTDSVIAIDFNYEEGTAGDFIPVVRNYVVRNLKSRKSMRALDVQGFKRAPIINLRLESCIFENVARPNVVDNVTGMVMRDVRINGQLVNQGV